MKNAMYYWYLANAHDNNHVPSKIQEGCCKIQEGCCKIQERCCK